MALTFNIASQTMDGAGNMAGSPAGCAALFTKESPKAVYHYCSSHDLNLALCKSEGSPCNVKYIKTAFKYSKKRCRRLEAAIESYDSGKDPSNQTKKFTIYTCACAKLQVGVKGQVIVRRSRMRSAQGVQMVSVFYRQPLQNHLCCTFINTTVHGHC